MLRVSFRGSLSWGSHASSSGLSPNADNVSPSNVKSFRGSLSWGSRPSSSGLSPNADNISPSNVKSAVSRFENHGVDPNVGIVPKGSLSWGSRVSSFGLSPNADNVSPSNLSGRPSSGGSDTRPSTAGSEPSSDSSVAWGETGIVEKLVSHFSKNDGNSFSSRDIPTLDSQKDKCGKKSDSQVSAPNVGLASSVQAQGGQKQSAKRMELALKWESQRKTEEEERIREQKAKPEEFNRRTKDVDDLIQNVEKSLPNGAVHCEGKESGSVFETVVVAIKHETPSTTLVSKSNVVRSNEFTVLPRDSHVEEIVDSNLVAQEVVATNSKHAPQVSAGNNSKSMYTSDYQKLNIQVDDALTEKLIPTGTAPKRQRVMVVNEVPPSEVTCDIGSSIESNLAGNSNSTINNSDKNMHKFYEALPPAESNVGKSSTESGKKASQIGLNPGTIQSVSNVVTDAIQSSEPHKVHNRCTSIFKSAIDSLRVQDLQQGLSHEHALPSNPDDQEIVVTNSKHAPQVSAGNNSKSKYMSYNQKLNIQVDDALIEKLIPTGSAEAPKRQSVMVVNDIPPSEVTCDIGSSFESNLAGNSNSTINSSDKNKHKLYEFPPPAESNVESGKKACQMGLDPSTIHSVSNVVTDAIQYSEPHIAEPDAMERYVPKPVAKEHAQHGRIRQQKPLIGRVDNGCTSIFRTAVESVRVQNMQQGSSSALNQRKDLHISSKRDVISGKADPVVSNEWDPSDGWNIAPEPAYSTTVSPVTSFMKDQSGANDQGQRLSLKGGPKNPGKNLVLDHKNISWESHRSYRQSAGLEIRQIYGNLALKDGRGSSHLQPKPQAPLHQRGNSSTGARHFSANVSIALKKDISHTQLHHSVHSVCGNQEVWRERKASSYRGRPYSPNQGVVSTDQSASGAGFRNGSHSYPSGGDWSSAWPDNRQHCVPPANRVQREKYSNHEYQTSGKSKKFQGPTDGSCGMGSKYSERGGSSSRRGGGIFCGRQSDIFQADAG